MGVGVSFGDRLFVSAIFLVFSVCGLLILAQLRDHRLRIEAIESPSTNTFGVSRPVLWIGERVGVAGVTVILTNVP